MVNIHSFTTSENLNSPFVKGAKKVNARFYGTFKGKHTRKVYCKTEIFKF